MDSSDLSADLNSTYKHQRTIIHIDVDCFYAQVEMIKNPDLRQQPLGIQQKNIVVTSNYVAREYGVQKCMLVSDALKLCPSLVLVSGEDLYDYRQMSGKISNLLHKFSPLVEKLGLDENFIDVTEVVKERLLQGDTSDTCEGQIYDRNLEQCECGCHGRLCLGSSIASEMRKTIFEELNVTTCAGISYNKLLAKLVGSVHKPNQQTTLFPSGVASLLFSLQFVRSIPGIGACMNNLLKTLDIDTISDLQNATLECLLRTMGQESALRIKKLSFGIDDSVVKQTGKPQTIGLEDGFQKIALECDVRNKFNTLMQRLTKLLMEDGRMPGSVKITVRQYDRVAKHSHRESRQCNISPSLFSPNVSGHLKPEANEKLLSSIMQLFHKIVNIQKPFHLTLLGVAFTKFQERSTGKSCIASFLQKDLSVQSVMDLKNARTLQRDSDSSPTSIPLVGKLRLSTDKSGSESEMEPSPKKTRKILWVNTRKRFADEMDQDSPSKLRVSELRLSSPRHRSAKKLGNCSTQDEMTSATTSNGDQLQCPVGIDQSVFRELPLDVQEELVAEWRRTEEVVSQPKVNKGAANSIIKYLVPNKNMG